MRSLFIINPKAGRSRLWKRFQKIHPGKIEVVRTQRRGHAGELAAEALKKGFTRIAAVGGDGTLSETADGLLNAGPLPKDFALVHLPAGSGCDFARHFGLPTRPERWPELLSHGRVIRIDAGRAFWQEEGREVSRYFINIAMAGLAGDIVHSMERFGKPLGGTLSYLAVSLAHLLSSRPKRIHLSLDGHRSSKDYHMLALANTSSTGGGMRIAPNADAEDGLLDFVAVRGLSLGKLIQSFPKIYAGTHLSVEGVENSRVKTMTAESSEEVLLNLDGEPIGRLPARFEIIPRALPLLVP